MMEGEQAHLPLGGGGRCSLCLPTPPTTGQASPSTHTIAAQGTTAPRARDSELAGIVVQNQARSPLREGHRPTQHRVIGARTGS